MCGLGAHCWHRSFGCLQGAVQGMNQEWYQWVTEPGSAAFQDREQLDEDNSTEAIYTRTPTQGTMKIWQLQEGRGEAWSGEEREVRHQLASSEAWATLSDLLRYVTREAGPNKARCLWHQVKTVIIWHQSVKLIILDTAPLKSRKNMLFLFLQFGWSNTLLWVSSSATDSWYISWAMFRENKSESFLKKKGNHDSTNICAPFLTLL